MTKRHESKSPKTQKDFKSKRSWKNKVIQTGEAVDKPIQDGTPSIPSTGFSNAESYVDSEGYVNCYIDGRLVSRYPTYETRTRLQKEKSDNE